jgi:UDP-glucose 4-epimerase
MKQKIFITGIAGFVGSSLANKLHELGYQVIGCDNLKFGYIINLNPEILWITDDFLNIKNIDADVLVHCATDNIIYAQTNCTETVKTNALKSIDFLNRFDGKIIYTSTSSVYGNAKNIPTKESDEIQVSNPYDISKYILEQYLQQRSNYTTLRLSNVYGINQRPENPYCGVVSRFIDCIRYNKPIMINGNGNATRDYTYINDVVNALIICIYVSALETEINIGTGKETSIFELIEIIGKCINHSTQIHFKEGRSIDLIQRRCLDINKAKKMLNWYPEFSLEQGMKDMLTY